MAGKSTWNESTGTDKKDPEVIRAQIEETRARLAETVEEIKKRLSPSHLRSEAVEKLREATVDKFRDGISERAASVLNGSPAARKVVYNALTAAFFGISFGRHIFRMAKSNGRVRPEGAGTGRTSITALGCKVPPLK